MGVIGPLLSYAGRDRDPNPTPLRPAANAVSIVTENGEVDKGEEIRNPRTAGETEGKPPERHGGSEGYRSRSPRGCNGVFRFCALQWPKVTTCHEGTKDSQRAQRDLQNTLWVLCISFVSFVGHLCPLRALRTNGTPPCSVPYYEQWHSTLLRALLRTMTLHRVPCLTTNELRICSHSLQAPGGVL